MKIKDAIQRLGFRFSEGVKSQYKSFKIYEKDIEAIKTLVKFYEDSISIQGKKDELMYKMYIRIRGQVMAKYKADPTNKIAQKQTARLLCSDLNLFINEFCDLSNLSEYEQVCKEKSIIDKHPNLLTEEERKENLRKVSELRKTNDLDRFMGKSWKPENIGDNLLIELNQLLNIL